VLGIVPVPYRSAWRRADAQVEVCECAMTCTGHHAEHQHRALTRPFFHPGHISPALFAPRIRAFMTDLPDSKAFDIQARLGELALQMSILWLCGEDISPAVVDRSDMPAAWKRARGELGAALVEAQRVVGKRVKIGTIWVGKIV